MRIKSKTIARFGFCSDPALPRRVNLYNHVLSFDITALSSRITNLSCHNLCETLSPPPLFASLLGLGLKFCPTPSYTTSPEHLDRTLDRFSIDFHTKVMFCGDRFHDTWSPKQLYIRDEFWIPKTWDIPHEIQVRTAAFCKALRPHFRKRKALRNLSPIQEHLLRTLRNNPQFLVVPSDKNLGPVLLERDTYVRRCLTDHLLKDTYEAFTSTEATAFTDATRELLNNFERDHSAVISADDMKYLNRYRASVQDPYAYFYALVKVHKRPWQTRPIVSVSGSLLYGLGKWLDQQLQPFIKSLPTYLSSSTILKQDLDKMRGTNFRRMSLFTGDIIAMYPSIDLDDAFHRISDFLSNSPL